MITALCRIFLVLRPHSLLKKVPSQAWRQYRQSFFPYRQSSVTVTEHSANVTLPPALQTFQRDFRRLVYVSTFYAVGTTLVLYKDDSEKQEMRRRIKVLEGNVEQV